MEFPGVVHPLINRGGRGWPIILGFCCVLLLAVEDAPGQIAGRGGNEDAFLMAPRSLSRLLREGEAAIADGRFAEGVRLLGSLLQEDSQDVPEDLRGQDFFVEGAARGLYQKSIKGEAIRLLSLLPPEGRRILEIQFGVMARQQLDVAIAARDFNAVAIVARKYMHTDAGYDAQLLIAQQKLVHGYPLAAAGIFQNLLDFPAARARYGVELAQAAALAWLQADNRTMAQATLQQAGTDFSGSSLMVQGQQIPVNSSTSWAAVVDAWQNDLRGLAIKSTTDAWLVAGGSPERNARADAGLPIANARWVKEIHSSVPERDALLEVEDATRKAGNVILPKFELRIVDNSVITKTTDAGVIGIDFESGNTKWVHYFGSSAAPLRSVSMNRNFVGDDSVSRELQKRVWGSTAFGRFSCDRERLYYISTDGEQPINTVNLFGGVVAGRESNYLEGVSIAAQGAILWRVGGATGQDEPRLAGAYFLGPPLAFEGELFTLAEINGEIRLLVLDPASGRLLWLQQIAQAALLPITYDEARQCHALSPTIADGVVLCPTGIGAVAAVDLLSRSLLWGALYRSNAANGINPFRGGAFGASMPEYAPLNRRWEDAAMIADRGRLLVSPPDSELLFCRDTLTGESLLASHPRRNARYVAGMVGDNIILVSETGVSAVGLIDKRVAWETAFPDERVLAGKGLWQNESLLIPLSGQRIVQIDLVNGQLTGQVDVDQPLGNLFAYRKQLLSVTSTAVAAFYTRESLRTEVETRIAANADDPWALTQQGQLAAAAGDVDRALALLQRSLAVDSQNADTRYLLVETMLKAMEADFDKYFTLANELSSIVEYGPQRFRYLQQLALGSIRSGQQLIAFKRLMELMEDRMKLVYSGTPARSSLLKLDSRHSVDSEAWIATALARAYSAASVDQRQEMDQLIAASMDRVAGTMVPLRRQRLQYLQWLPPVAADSIELASELLGGTEQTIGEQLLQPLLSSPNESVQSTALRLLGRPAAADIRWLGPSGRDYSALDFPEQLRSERQADPASNDFRIPEVAIPEVAIPEVVWNAGQVQHRTIKEFPLFPLSRRIELSGERYGRPEFAVSLSDSLLALFNTNGESVGSLTYNAASSDLTNSYTRAAYRGGLLILETGSEIVAFDIYRGLNGEAESLLWRHSLVGAAPDEQFIPTNTTTPNAALGINIPKRQVQNGQPASVGPLTPAAQIVQAGTSIQGLDLLTGKRLWTRDGYGEDLRFASQGLFVAIVNPSEGKVQIIDCRDGQLLHEQEYRGNWTHWFSHAANVVDFQQADNGGDVIVRIWNAITGTTSQEFTVPFTARAAQCEQRYLVIAEPGKRIIYADLATGVVHEHEADVDRNLDSIGLARFQDRLIVFGQALVRTRQPSRTSTEERLNGFVQAFHIDSGLPVWDQVAKFAGMVFPISQPRNSPFMVLYRFGDTDAPTLAAFVLLDLRDGRICFADRNFLVRSAGFNMQLRPMEQRVDLAIGDRNYRFLMTTEELPPQPVASFGFDKARVNLNRRAPPR